VWWHRPVIPALRMLRQEDCKLKASLRYKWKPGSNTKMKQYQEKMDDNIRRKRKKIKVVISEW
jgi:hypothetical protein